MGLRASMGTQDSVAGYGVKTTVQNQEGGGGGHLNMGYGIGFYS